MHPDRHIQIRPSTLDELAAIRQLAREIWPACYSSIISPQQIEYMLERMYSLEQLQADVTSGITFDLLLENNVPVGFASYGTSDPSGNCKLHKLYVLPSHHGRGLGSLLVQHVIRAAKARNAPRLLLNVNKKNTAAIAAYLRNGFSVLEEVVIDIGRGFVMDDYVMILPLVQNTPAASGTPASPHP